MTVKNTLQFQSASVYGNDCQALLQVSYNLDQTESLWLVSISYYIQRRFHSFFGTDMFGAKPGVQDKSTLRTVHQRKWGFPFHWRSVDIHVKSFHTPHSKWYTRYTSLPHKNPDRHSCHVWLHIKFICCLQSHGAPKVGPSFIVSSCVTHLKW